MITDLQLHKIINAFANKLHISSAVHQGIVHKVAEGVLQSLPIR
jgi:hypothetical protein